MLKRPLVDVSLCVFCNSEPAAQSGLREPRPDRWPHGWPITLESLVSLRVKESGTVKLLNRLFVFDSRLGIRSGHAT